MIVPVTYWTAVCDGCGEDQLEGNEFSAWSDPQDAEDHSHSFPLSTGELACSTCERAYRERLSDVEDERLTMEEFWAEAAFRGWLRARLTGQESGR